MMIGARTAAWVKSGYTAKDYVQDGLIAMWDGIENAGWGVHDPNATAWKDLSGNGYDMNVIDVSGWRLNHAFVNGLFSKTKNMIALNNMVHSEACVSIPNAGGVIFWNDCNTSGSQRFIAPNAIENESISCRYGFSSLVNPFPGTGTVSAYHNEAIIYFNGNRIANLSGSVYKPGSYSGEMLIGSRSRYGGSYGFYLTDSKVFCVRVYSRMLGLTEIAANYAIDNSRFNLT